MTETTTTERSKIIKLNVGGTLFYTTKSTLLSRGDSYFTGLLNGMMKREKEVVSDEKVCESVLEEFVC